MTVDIIRTTKLITQLSARTLAAGHAQVAGHGQAIIRNMAEEQGLRVVAAAQADLAQRAVERWIELLYEREGSTWWNVRSDGMIWLAPPWSRSRRVAYGLSEPQSRLLLRIVKDLIGGLPDRRRLYSYLPQHQRYALNRAHFPAVAAALEWQRTIGAVTAAQWKAYSERYPGGRL